MKNNFFTAGAGVAAILVSIGVCGGAIYAYASKPTAPARGPVVQTPPEPVIGYHQIYGGGKATGMGASAGAVQ